MEFHKILSNINNFLITIYLLIYVHLKVDQQILVYKLDILKELVHTKMSPHKTSDHSIISSRK